MERCKEDGGDGSGGSGSGRSGSGSGSGGRVGIITRLCNSAYNSNFEIICLCNLAWDSKTGSFSYTPYTPYPHSLLESTVKSICRSHWKIVED